MSKSSKKKSLVDIVMGHFYVIYWYFIFYSTLVCSFSLLLWNSKYQNTRLLPQNYTQNYFFKLISIFLNSISECDISNKSYNYIHFSLRVLFLFWDRPKSWTPIFVKKSWWKMILMVLPYNSDSSWKFNKTRHAWPLKAKSYHPHLPSNPLRAIKSEITTVARGIKKLPPLTDLMWGQKIHPRSKKKKGISLRKDWTYIM